MKQAVVTRALFFPRTISVTVNDIPVNIVLGNIGVIPNRFHTEYSVKYIFPQNATFGDFGGVTNRGNRLEIVVPDYRFVFTIERSFATVRADASGMDISVVCKDFVAYKHK